MWQIITEQCTNEDGVSYTAYGIRCDERIVHDLTSLRDEAERFLALINDLDVSPLHIADVIEDYLANL